jgi:hypothetical protein
MNKVIEEKLVASLDEVQKWAESTKDFVSEQAPLVVQEVIRWGIAQNIFWTLLFAILMILVTITWLYIRKSWKWDTSVGDGRDWFPVGFFLNGICVLINFVMFTFLSSAVYNLVYIWVAPRLYVLDQLATLLNRANGGN